MPNGELTTRKKTMITELKSFKRIIKLVLTLALPLILIACAPVAATEEMQMDDGAHEHKEDEVERIPNDGATIEIVSPEHGTTFASTDDVVVEVAIENFTLNDEGSHWHVYVDGESHGMVVGINTRQALHGLAPGEHMIEAYLALGTHEELQDAGTVHITVTE